MTEPDDVTVADLEAYAKLHDLVPVPDDLLPRVIQALREHREAMRRFAAAGIDTREVFPAQVFRA